MKSNLIFFKRLTTFIIFTGIVLYIYGCQSEPTSSLYKGNQQYLPAPVVDSISPSGSALAGIDTVIIYGKNFSSLPDANHETVFFNGTSVPIIGGTPTTIRIIAPAIQGTITVQVSVTGALPYSTVVYKLIAAISAFGNLDTTYAVYALGSASDSSLYAAMTEKNIDRGVLKVTSDGISSYASATSVVMTGIKFGLGGYLYAVRGNRVVYRYAPGGGSSQNWAVTPSGSFFDLDFDPSGNLWVGGSGTKTGSDTTNIIRVKQDATTKAFHFTGTINSVRYYDGYLYFVSKTGPTPSKVYRAPIINDTLGTPEVYFDISSDPADGSNIYAITFSSDGNMYAGVDSSYLMIVHPGGFIEKPYSLFIVSGVLNSPCRSFAWIGDDLYASTASGKLLKIVVRKPGAPYYGLQ
ncbi:MAG: IPT/TIG domain-containing protein [Bacteroidota bacterium]|nr:IPT/TIG domain-containing protein [Bacteroidota bacterium]